MATLKAKFVDDKQLGQRLKALRKQRNMTLQQVSELTNVSVSTLSKFENAKTGLAFRNVIQLAEGLGVPISTFMDNTPVVQSSARMSVVKASSISTIEEPQLRFEKISGNLKNVGSVYFRVTVLARSPEDYDQFHVHAGEEFLHILSGQIELHTEGYKPVILSPGDSVHFDSAMGHLYVSISKEPAVMLMANTLHDETGQLELIDDQEAGVQNDAKAIQLRKILSF